jgi:hypothetical protein
MFTACSVYPNLRHVRFSSLVFQKMTRASGVNFRHSVLYSHTRKPNLAH